MSRFFLVLLMPMLDPFVVELAAERLKAKRWAPRDSQNSGEVRVDLSLFWHHCAEGPVVSLPPCGCRAKFDFDLNGKVDLADRSQAELRMSELPTPTHLSLPWDP